MHGFALRPNTWKWWESAGRRKPILDNEGKDEEGEWTQKRNPCRSGRITVKPLPLEAAVWVSRTGCHSSCERHVVQAGWCFNIFDACTAERCRFHWAVRTYCAGGTGARTSLGCFLARVSRNGPVTPSAGVCLPSGTEKSSNCRSESMWRKITMWRASDLSLGVSLYIAWRLGVSRERKPGGRGFGSRIDYVSSLRETRKGDHSWSLLPPGWRPRDSPLAQKQKANSTQM